MNRLPSILVVDDDRDTCLNLADILGELGYRVKVAHDGPSAVELVRQAPYDVALLDLKMPGMNGVELYRAIKQLRAGTVAIIMTAYASQKTAHEALSAGAWQVLAKPINLHRVLDLVHQALDQPLLLVVDDDREFCASLWDILRERGYRVAVAGDCDSAARQLHEEAFDVVLIDMKLPRCTGNMIYHLVRQSNPSAHTIVITGYARDMEHAINEIVNQGADAVCYKPFDVPNLLGMLGQLVTKPRQNESAPD